MESSIREYQVSNCHELSVDYNGNNYMVIYGRHINGGFCCIPNWNVGCELSQPEDVFWNREKLSSIVGNGAAKVIANAIMQHAQNAKSDEIDKFSADLRDMVSLAKRAETDRGADIALNVKAQQCACDIKMQLSDYKKIMSLAEHFAKLEDEGIYKAGVNEQEPEMER